MKALKHAGPRQVTIRWVCFLVALFVLPFNSATGQVQQINLPELQQQFVDLKFGMFIHYNIPTYMNEDWPDPNAPAAIFNPTKLDCNQWARAAKSANMSYGCLTTKHHSGFCIWDTKTTDYNVMNSPLKRDVVKEYVEAFRKQGLKTMLYYSILDTHHKLRPHLITKKHIEMVKAQLTELLSNYGEITALIIDGWDAPWSRISYEDVPFEEVYRLVKRIQPNCLVMDLNAAKYPAEALFYTDIKSYEQGAGQHISKESNNLPALSCLPINQNWFWKESFPSNPVKDPLKLVAENIVPLNAAHCNFILNVAPNRDGLIDDNAIEALKTIGKNWKNDGSQSKLSAFDAPILSENIAKHVPSDASWSNDMWIMDFANDDDFQTSWVSNSAVKNPWYEIDFPKDRSFNAIMIDDSRHNIKKYRLQYEENGEWKTILNGESDKKIKIHRFDRVWGGKIRITMDECAGEPAIAEFGVYDERRVDKGADQSANGVQTYNHGGFTLNFECKSPTFSKGTNQKLIDTFFKVYPVLVEAYNLKAPKQVSFVIDPDYDGVAATSDDRVVFSSKYMTSHPGDIDVVTHEVMHIVQNYGDESGMPGWLTEGIADYVRYTYGVDNTGAGWSLPSLTKAHNYQDSYRISARFLVWLEHSGYNGIVTKLDRAGREKTYNNGAIWTKITGKTVDKLWVEYANNPKI